MLKKRMLTGTRTDYSDKSLTPYLLIFLISSIPFLWNLSIERFFSTDGAYYFSLILDSRHYTDFAWPRNHAAYLTQWPLVMATALGVTHLGLLKFCFGFGLYFPAICSFLICLKFADRNHRPLLVFPVFSFLSITNVGAALMFGESHVLTYLTWPILFILIRPKPYSPAIAVVLALLLVTYTRCYEGAVFTGSIFSTMILVRLKLHKTTAQRALNLFFLLLVLLAVAIAVQSILDPRDPGNRAGFIETILGGLSNPLFLCAVSFIALFLVGMVTNSKRFIGPGLLISTLGYLYLIFYGSEISAYESFQTRTLTASYLPFLMIFAWALSRMNVSLPKKHWHAVLIFVGVSAWAQIHSAGTWMDFRAQFKHELSRHSGFVKREDTALNSHSHLWGWASPTLSYLWSEYEVKTIILNPEFTGWEPFDPRSQRILRDYIATVAPLPE